MDDEDDDDGKDFGVYPGYVVDNKDPDGRHRVRVHVPGLYERTAWAVPQTSGGGAVPNSAGDATRGSGFHAAPRLNAVVFVSFLYGDPERPTYVGGDWGIVDGKSNMPADIVAAGKDAHLVQAGEWRFADLSLRVVIDERPGKRALKVYAVDLQNSEDPIATIEIDLEGRGIVVYGLTGVAVQSSGFVQLTAPVLQLNERTVRTAAAPV